ncbi:hypothetical protein [Methylovirgula sp. 4M-Z18]|uniref:hypothetical protein n=1 Tax=Methylovirgula sp. 4M-Z18 TaxID=2293567 RepID=UPI000E2FF18D|nr:hypothetical protein [Methylovirgula sp. 4M-Z18]RFB80377.1 hypothetical protein DYH55_02295 [Methylovirgula sp. 4M-Z18]
MARGILYMTAEEGRAGAGWYIDAGEFLVVGPNQDEAGNFVPFPTREAAEAWAKGGKSTVPFLQPIGLYERGQLH